MNYQVWGFPLAIVASFFFLAALCKVAAKEMPKPPEPEKPEPTPEPYPEPFVSWRIVMEQFEGRTVPSTIALDMNSATEKYLGTHEWVRLP